MTKIELNLFNESGCKINLSKLKADLIKILSLNLPPDLRQKLNKLDIALILSGSNRLRALNKKYAGKDKTTDVLSFVWQKGKGDIFINLDLANQMIIKRLFVHGLLHILGFDHQTVLAEKTMISLEERILK